VSLTTATGVLLIVSALWFNTWFAALSKRFDYPDVLRRPTEEILTRFRAGGSSLILTWWAFMASGGLLVASGLDDRGRDRDRRRGSRRPVDRMARASDRRRTRRRLRGVPRAERADGLETRGEGDPGALRRLVGVARRRRLALIA
jgi:hypothetical protein